MEQPGRPVSRDEFEGRKVAEDERFRRDKERLDEYQKAIAELTKISGTLSQSATTRTWASTTSGWLLSNGNQPIPGAGSRRPW